MRVADPGRRLIVLAPRHALHAGVSAGHHGQRQATTKRLRAGDNCPVSRPPRSVAGGFTVAGKNESLRNSLRAQVQFPRLHATAFKQLPAQRWLVGSPCAIVVHIVAHDLPKVRDLGV